MHGIISTEREKEMKLSKAQKRTLDKMKVGVDYCAYDLGCSLATLETLRKKGLVISRAGPGSFAFPQNGIKWRIKEKNEMLMRP